MVWLFDTFSFGQAVKVAGPQWFGKRNFSFAVFLMEKHVLSGKPSAHRKLEEQELAEACQAPAKRRKTDYSDAFVKEVTDLARQIGPTHAQRKYKEV